MESLFASELMPTLNVLLFIAISSKIWYFSYQKVNGLFSSKVASLITTIFVDQYFHHKFNANENVPLKSCKQKCFAKISPLTFNFSIKAILFQI